MVPMKIITVIRVQLNLCATVFSVECPLLWFFQLVVSQTHKRCPFVSCPLGFIVLCLKVEKESLRQSSSCSVVEPFEETGVHNM